MLSQTEFARIACAITIAATISLRGLRSQSLSSSGASAAFLVGFLTWAASVRFGITLISFYLASTRATRFKATSKARLEDGYKTSHGSRSAMQVLASSLPGVVVAVAFVYQFRLDGPISSRFPFRSTLLLAYLLFFSACAGDTFSSELGLVLPKSGTDPVLITTPWRRVPRGTNGGVSWQGTVASAFGGFVIGIVYFVTGPEWKPSQLFVIAVGVVGGVLGSLMDSLIGATLQATWFDLASGKVLKDPPHESERRKDRYRHVCGIDLLNGEMVNLLAGAVTMALAPFFVRLFFADHPEEL